MKAACNQISYSVDIAALAACPNGTTNGWTTCGIDSYSNTSTTVSANIRFNSAEEYALSPDFAAPILCLKMRVKSSSTSGRRLLVIPIVDGRELPDRALYCEYSPTKDSFIDQTIEVPTDNEFSRFKLALSAANNTTTGWGISSLTVITANASPSPANLRTSRIYADRFTAEWDNPSGAVSNQILVLRSIIVPFYAEFTTNYTFEAFSNRNTTTQLTDKFISLYPDFSGVRLYAPTNSSGIVRIGTSDQSGELIFKGLKSYANLLLVMRAQKDKNSNKHHAPVAYISDNTTNIIGRIAATEEKMQHFIVPLDGVPDGASLHIYSCVGDFKSNSDSRLFIDSVGFATIATAEHTEEQTIANTFTSAERQTFRLLERETLYCWQVRSFFADGSKSEWSARQDATTTNKSSGRLWLYLR